MENYLENPCWVFSLQAEVTELNRSVLMITWELTERTNEEITLFSSLILPEVYVEIVCLSCSFVAFYHENIELL